MLASSKTAKNNWQNGNQFSTVEIPAWTKEEEEDYN